MGLVFQLQRRAIEDLRHEDEAIPVTDLESLRTISTSNGERLYVVGISPGIGTCSDVLDMDVLVLADAPVIEQRKVGRLACAYAVLVRDLTDQERLTDSFSKQGVARKCVELLKLLNTDDDGTTVFDRTGKVSIYTKLASG